MHALKLTNAMLFLSTLSLRRATVNDAINGCNPDIISIHALLAESDLREQFKYVVQCRFLSTLSLRRATLVTMLNRPRSQISIHALLAESDYHTYTYLSILF